MAEADLKPCFVAAPIGSAGSDTRRRSDRLLEHVFKPAALECGYQAFRADEDASSGIITDHVIAHLLNSPMVIADLTERNSNVFYELAIRHMIEKPLVHVIRAGDPVPFDVASLRVLQLADPELENFKQSQQLLCDFIRAAAKEPGRNPISSAARLEALRSSGDPLKTEMAQMKDQISQLRTLIQNLQSSEVREVNLGTALTEAERRARLRKLARILRQVTPEREADRPTEKDEKDLRAELEDLRQEWRRTLESDKGSAGT